MCIRLIDPIESIGSFRIFKNSSICENCNMEKKRIKVVLAYKRDPMHTYVSVNVALAYIENSEYNGNCM